jgi:hypothetical protein
MKRCLVALPVLLSLASCSGSSRWKAIAPKDARCEILMPASPRGTENRFRLPDGGEMTGWNYILEDRKTGLSFTLGYNDWPEAWISSRPTDWFLDSGRDGMIKTLGGTLARETSITLDGNPGREVIGEIPGLGTIWGRMFMVGRRYYQVSVIYTPGKADYGLIGRYFDSFKIHR